jgi:hypothetical protein
MSSLTVSIRNDTYGILQSAEFTNNQEQNIHNFLRRFFDPENILAILSPFECTDINAVTASSNITPYKDRKFTVFIHGNRNIMAAAAVFNRPPFYETAEPIETIMRGPHAEEISPHNKAFSITPFQDSSLKELKCNRTNNLITEITLSKK